MHHRDNGLFQQAHAGIEFVRDAAGRRWDREHPVVQAAAHACATTLRTMGRLRESEYGLREVVEVRRRTSGERHPDTLAARHDLGAVLNSLARRSEARAEFELVLRARVELLGAPRTSPRRAVRRRRRRSWRRSSPAAPGPWERTTPSRGPRAPPCTRSCPRPAAVESVSDAGTAGP
ncbi:tetratricopeptide repeat protein [Streptomyces sp. NPDC051211]|uniref:tetratricopeptide repeat protein n=1 Tax=Streptomyces sp. NPDC051211 TaxID=3154643 RepID=UPI00344C29F8